MRRPLLSVLLASIAVNAALGIYALVVPTFGELQGRVLLTSVCVTGAGVVALACLPAWERGRLAPLPVVSVAVSAFGLVLAVAAVWSDSLGGEPAFEKTIASLLLVGGGGALCSLLALARLAPRFSPVLPVTTVLVAVLAAAIVAQVWGQWQSEWIGRVYGVIAVLVAAFVLAIPVLHRAGAHELVAPEAAGVRFCPGCGGPAFAAPEEEAACTVCGARFRIHYVREPAVERGPVARPAVEEVPREEPEPLARARPDRGT